MHFRHRTTKAVVEAPVRSEYGKDPAWEKIGGAEEPAASLPPGVQDAPTPEPLRDLSDLSKSALLELADREGLTVNRRLGTQKLAEQIVEIAPVAPPPERDLAPGT